MSVPISGLTDVLTAAGINSADDVEFGVTDAFGSLSSASFALDQLLVFMAGSGVGFLTDLNGFYLDVDGLSENIAPDVANDTLCMTRPGQRPQKIKIQTILDEIADTDLASSPTTTQVTITNTNGTDAVIAAASASQAGVLSAADWARFDASDAPTLTFTETPTGVDLAIDSGTGDTLALATQVNAGAMAPGDKQKLDNLFTSVDLSIGTHDATQLEIDNTGGTNVILPLVDTTGDTAGLMSPADKTTLDSLSAQVTNLSIGAQDGTTLEIDNTAGTNVTLPQAVAGGFAGLLAGADQQKLDLVIHVDSDPTGTQDGSSAANNAVAQAVANGGGRIVFPEGTTLIESPIVLPLDNSGTNRRIIFDLNGTTITTTQPINVFQRQISDYNATDNRNWMITIENGSIQQTGTARTGTAVYLDKSTDAIIRELRISSFAQAISLAFCLHHRVENINGVGNEAGLLVTTGDRRGWTNLPSASNSNQGLWSQVRFQTATNTGRGFDSYGAGNITLINCTVETTTAVDYGYSLDGDTTGAGSLQSNRTIEMIDCWWEIGSSATVGTGAVKISNMRRSTVSVQFSSASWPDSLMIACSNNSRSNIIVKPCVGLQDQANKLIPIFDADRKAGSDTNIWYFEQQMISSNVGSLRNPALWVDAEVPTVRERSYDYLTGGVIDSDLTIPANSFLVNADPSGDDLVKPTRVSDLPEGTYTVGNLVFGQNDSGDLAHFDVASLAAAPPSITIDNDTGGALGIDFSVNRQIKSQILTTVSDIAFANMVEAEEYTYIMEIASAANVSIQTQTTPWYDGVGPTFAGTPGAVTIVKLRIDTNGDIHYLRMT